MSLQNPTVLELAILVKTVRELERLWHKTGAGDVLIKSKAAEKILDETVNKIILEAQFPPVYIKSGD
jgi:hypothetical protein